MILVDILSYNLTNVLMFTTPLMVYDLNDKRLYITLIFDVIFNGVPFCTITLYFYIFLTSGLLGMFLMECFTFLYQVYFF